MSARWRRLAVLVAAASLAACAAPHAPRREAGLELPSLPAAGARPERVVLVSIHGLAPSAYLPPAGAPTAPVLAALGAAGVAAEAVRPVFPPDALPAGVSLVTGLGPDRHGVVSDRELGEHGLESTGRIAASAIHGRTLLQVVSAAGAQVAAFDWPATAGAPLSAWLPDVDPERIGGGAETAWLTGATPSVAALARAAGAGAPAALPPGPAHDAVVVAAACGILAGPAPPRLALVRLGETRAGGAPGSASSTRALAGADASVGRLVACLRQSGRLAGTGIVVTGDHGLMPVHSAVRPDLVLLSVGLITADSRGRVVHWDAFARSNGGSAFVYARDADSALLARRALEDEAARTGVFRVASAQEMLRFGADPQAWFGLMALPGWVFDDAVVGPSSGPAATEGAGGYDPDEEAMTTGLVAWGAGLRPGLRIPQMRQIDVAPFVARWLGVDLPDAEGRSLDGLFRAAAEATITPATTMQSAPPPRAAPAGRTGGRTRP
jgi:hypothetical protein